ncbi:MAG: HAD family hydrolase [Hydrogenoanaerobacterium sp.]
MTKLMIFDLDGTLLDTIHDLAAATNTVLTKHGYPTHTTPEYNYLVGNGVVKLITRALPENARTEQNIEEIKNEQVAYYNAHLYDNTKPFDGIPQALEKLQEQGVMLAVVTNKPDEAAKELIKSFFPNIGFAQVQGNCEGVPIKPNPAAVNRVIENSGVLKNEVLYFGDSDVDMIVAKNAGVTGVGVLWGYRTKEELQNAGAQLLIKHPQDILTI